MKYFQRLRQFNKKVIVSGNVLEVYEYEKPIVKGIEKKRKGRSNSLFTTAEIKLDNRSKVARRARAIVRRTANANPDLKKFLTLTFAKNITDISYARYEFDKFIKRLKTRFKALQFINVIEFQKRGAIHFHLLCNLPYINVNELSRIWKHGFIKLNRIDNIDNVGAYITKYMTKDNIDDRLIGKKCYTMSKGLKKPAEYTKECEIEKIFNNLEHVKRVYTSQFESEYYGTITYTQIICYKPFEPPKKAIFIKRLKRPFFTPLPIDTPCPFTV